MEVFTDVAVDSFRTGFPSFQRPTGTKTGSEPCIAVTSRQGQLLTALYSIIVTLLFIVCWKIVSLAVMLLWSVSRGIALVGFWNAREPLEATCFTLGYLKRACAGYHIPSPTIRLLLLAVVWLVGTYAAGIFVAAELISGKVAPANPNKVYVPRPPGMSSADIMRQQALVAPATLRSLGSAEAAGNQHTIRKYISFDRFPRDKESLQNFTYKYTVTAHDMGLQKWHDLKQEVSGQCKVDSSWFSKNVPEEDLDVYRPWGLANKTVDVVYDGERKTAPSATAIPFPYAEPNFLINNKAEHRYGIIVHSSHRASYRLGTDPWYQTETFTTRDNETDARINTPPGNRVMGGRPALSCTQNDVWSYNGTQFKNIYELTDEANIKFPEGWVTQLQMDFSGPRIIEVINSAGSSSLASATTFVGGVFDAETSKIEVDMKRLLTATWISSAYTFRNMLMVDAEQNIDNVALKGTGQPQDGVDLFVVSTPQVATLRLSVLFAIPGLLAFFTFVLGILTIWGRRDKERYKNIHFAEGAYLYARTQDPVKFRDIERLGKVIRKCKQTS
ncbi:hypothetical protein B9Z19DRAFT_966898 [Tuber borchii]|uniref:Uncharacterized protein n=1 Tax=Tuber borchii TaxID=42251 RepID=A0A2T7A4I6_TUBBO|nr:hypothetical protein B9Z19DRAFT_966898 [Tuber borchii]